MESLDEETAKLLAEIEEIDTKKSKKKKKKKNKKISNSKPLPPAHNDEETKIVKSEPP